jgi:hypothetical protein
MGTGIEAFATGNCFLLKEMQSQGGKRNYAHALALDEVCGGWLPRTSQSFASQPVL